MDMKWPEMPSKVNFGHPIWPIDQKWPEMRSKVKWPPKKNNKILYRSEMARIAIESEFKNPKWPIDLKWPEIRLKVNFGHPK